MLHVLCFKTVYELSEILIITKIIVYKINLYLSINLQ